MLYANFGLERAINYLWQKMQTDTKRAPFPLSHFKILKLVENNYYPKQNRMVKLKLLSQVIYFFVLMFYTNPGNVTIFLDVDIRTELCKNKK
mgnify:CR=1 FL=1